MIAVRWRIEWCLNQVTERCRDKDKNPKSALLDFEEIISNLKFKFKNYTQEHMK